MQRQQLNHRLMKTACVLKFLASSFFFHLIIHFYFRRLVLFDHCAYILLWWSWVANGRIWALLIQYLLRVFVNRERIVVLCCKLFNDLTIDIRRHLLFCFIRISGILTQTRIIRPKAHSGLIKVRNICRVHIGVCLGSSRRRQWSYIIKFFGGLGTCVELWRFHELEQANHQ